MIKNNRCHSDPNYWTKSIPPESKLIKINNLPPLELNELYDNKTVPFAGTMKIDNNVFPEQVLKLLPDSIKQNYLNVEDMWKTMYPYKNRNKIIYYNKLINIKDKKYYFLKIIERQLYKSYIDEKEIYTKFPESERILMPIFYDRHKCTKIYLFPYYDTDLFTILLDPSKIPLKNIKLMFKNLSLAIQEIHRCNIVYGDVKPENVLVKDLSDIKLCDFETCIDIYYLCKNNKDAKNIANDIDDLKDIYKVIDKDTVKLIYHGGTPGYFAPECVSDSYFSLKSDIWALGIILYIMLTGDLPYTHNYLVEQITIRNTNFIKRILDKLKCSKEVRDLLDGMLNINRNERFTIEDVLNHKWLIDENLPINEKN